MAETPAFADLNKQFAALREGRLSVTAGHRDLGADLWLSADPDGAAVLSCAGSGRGLVLSLEHGDTGRWACLGMRLPVATLARGRYLGLLVSATCEGMLCCTPTLRYFRNAGGFEDVAAAMPLIIAGRGCRRLAHIPVDPDRLANAAGCELNLFFHDDRFSADFQTIEPLLML